MKKVFTLLLASALFSSMAWGQTVVSDEAGLTAALTAGGSIQMNADITLSTIATINQNVVLDLNGQTLTLSKAKGLTVNNGSLELTGTGTISSTTTNPLYVIGSQNDVANYSVLKVGSNVTINTTGNYALSIASSSADASKAYGIDVEVKGTLVSNKGIYVNSAIAQTSGNVPVLHLAGATISSKYKGLDLQGYVKTTLDSTTISLTTQSSLTSHCVEIKAGELTMNSGKIKNFNTLYGIYVNQKSEAVPVTVNIKGGTIEAGTPIFQMSADGNIFVSGGLFSKAVEAGFCAVGYHPTTTPDAAGYYTVAADQYAMTVYAGSSTADARSLTVAEWNDILAATPNAVAIVDNTPANQILANASKNIIVKSSNGTSGTYSYECPYFVLTDLCDWGNKDASTAAATNFYCPEDFKVTKGSYSRSLRGDFNSACVPFDITSDMFGYHELLTYSSYDKDDNDAMFNYQTAVTAGTAVIIQLAAAKIWTVDLAGKEIKGSPIVGSTFKGVFQTTNYQGAYSVNNQLEGKFSPLAGNLYPFRSCFKLDGDEQSGGITPAAPRLVILEAEETTNLDEMNANGQDTKFFQNGKLMIRHNGQVFDAAGKVVK